MVLVQLIQAQGANVSPYAETSFSFFLAKCYKKSCVNGTSKVREGVFLLKTFFGIKYENLSVWYYKSIKCKSVMG